MVMQLQSLKLLEDAGFSAEKARALVSVIDIMIDSSEIGPGENVGGASRALEIGSSRCAELTKYDVLLLRHDVMDICRELEREIRWMHADLRSRIEEVRKNLETEIERTRHSPEAEVK